MSDQKDRLLQSGDGSELRLELARGVLARLPDEDRATLREAADFMDCTLLEAAVALLPAEVAR